MNGRLSVNNINVFLTRKSNNLAGNFSAQAEFTAHEITDMMAALTAEMIAAANLDLHQVAADLLTSGGVQTDEGVFQHATWWATHKIHAIKQVRQMTGSGLKEAKDAFEQMLPVYYKRAADKALADLRSSNERAGYRFAEYVSQSTHHAVINSDDVPF